MFNKTISTAVSLALFMGASVSVFAEETVPPVVTDPAPAATTVEPVVAPVVAPVVVEITKQMIKDKTAACAKMEAKKDKRTCMKERNKMKRDFTKQEKAKRELARKEAKAKRELARKEAKAKREAARKLDSDQDGVPDLKDAFPQDPKESKDHDKDGVGNNADLDDDNDGVADTEDKNPLRREDRKDGEDDDENDDDGVVPVPAPVDPAPAL